jgi:pimeloyl-ACP methyl ester carboxylesterase
VTAPLFFIHGMWSTPATFARLRERLEAAGHATHAPALPYHDRAPDLPPLAEVGRLTVEDYARYLVAEIAKLPEPPVLIGHSMGGMLAQVVGTRVPHKGLVLLSTGPTATTMDLTDIRPLRAFSGILFRWGWWNRPTMIDAERARWSIYNGVPADIATAEIAALVPDSGRVLAEMMWPGLSETGATKVDYARLSQPALAIVGLDDRITPPSTSRATARKLAGPVDYHELPGVSHWLFWGETEQQVGTLIEDWLKTLP